jgi:hypothetical protein
MHKYWSSNKRFKLNYNPKNEVALTKEQAHASYNCIIHAL